MTDSAVRVMVMATHIGEDGAISGGRFRYESWPATLYDGAWIDIGGNDEEIESVRLRRTKDGEKYLLIDVPIEAGWYEHVENDPTWSDSPEDAIRKPPT